MKYRILFITILCLSVHALQASQIDGIIITKKDTLHVRFVVPFTGIDFTMLQRGVKYVDSLDNKCKLKPEDAKEIRFEYNGQPVRMLSRYDNLSSYSDGSTKIFLELIIDGPMKLFSYYVKNTAVTGSGMGGAPGASPIMMSTTYEKYVLQKGIGDLVRYGKMNFKNDMPVFVRKCPALVKLIQDKIYKRGDIEQIVSFYNANCGN
ncbi:hypothetical protein [uncultured Cytophaga sp.]|uniref:hypothetical protein n=1 Tax=uncultured Cytophaga sp. TaxID=160238 RepID=UPI002636CDD5|nr:hypothetical protein [uncultured Cytophaga sp.]